MASLANINIKFRADLKEFSSEMQNANRKITRQGKSMQKVGKSLTYGVTAPLVGIAAGAVKAAAELETLETSLAVMTGTAESGKAALKDLAEFTASTPFQLDQVGKAAKQLLAFGFSMSEVKAQLQNIGNIAAGSGNQIGEVAQIFGQVSAAGKLTGERFNQLQERAIPIGSAIAKSMGIAESSVKEFITKGKISFTDFETAFNSLAQTGGLFAGAMDKQSKTLAGVFSTLKDNVNLALGEIGVSITETFNLKEAAAALIGKIQGLTAAFKNLSPETQKIIVVIAAIMAALGPLLLALGFLMTNVIPGLITAYGFLKVATLAAATSFKTLTAAMVANPLGVIVAAIGALVYGFTYLVQKITPAVSKMQTFYNLLKSGGNVVAFNNLQIMDQIEAVNAEAEAEKERIKATEKINGLLDEYSTKTATATTETGKLTTAQLKAYDPKANNFDLKPIGSSFLATANATEKTDLPDLSGTAPAFLANADKIIDKQAELNAAMDMGPTLKAATAGAIAGFAEMVGAVISGNASLGDVFGGLIGMLGDIAIQIGKAAIAIGVSMLAVQLSFSNPWAAIAAGAALILVGTLMKSLSDSFSGQTSSRAPVAFASGGIVSGETLAMVGEYPGASSNPEVIAPLDKLKQYLQPQNNSIDEIKITGELKAEGRSLKLVLDRTNVNLLRTS